MRRSGWRESSWAPGRWLAGIGQLRQFRDLDLSDLRELLDNADVHEVRGLIRDLARELQREARRLAREHDEHWATSAQAGGGCIRPCAPRVRLFPRRRHLRYLRPLPPATGAGARAPQARGSTRTGCT